MALAMALFSPMPQVAAMLARAVKLIASKIADAVLEGRQGEQMSDEAIEEVAADEEEF